MFKNFVLLSICLIINVLSQTHLSGDVSGRVLSANENIYIVEDNISVESGKKLVIEKGSILLFSPFTGLTVYGSLEVNGTDENPVILTSISDTAYNPQSQILANPFDWNGILIHARASQVVLNNFKLSYSVYGIKSQREDVSIFNGIFFQNGQFHFTVNNQIQPVQDYLPFSYNSAKPVLTNDDSRKKEESFWKSSKFTWAGTSVLLSGVLSSSVLGLYYTGIANDHFESSKNPDITHSEYNRFYKKYEKFYKYSIAGFSSSGALLAATSGFFIWRTLKHKHGPEHIDVLPVISLNGISVNIRF